MVKKAQHVIPGDKGWKVISAGSGRARAKFETQKEAIADARKVARNEGSEMFIHGRNGRIRERDSYGNDPVTRKG
ncbi:MAG: DUF2188 domain-containing protein [Rhodospirillales bacterium]